MNKRMTVILGSAVAVIVVIVAAVYLILKQAGGRRMVSDVDGMTLVYIPAGEFTAGYAEGELAGVPNEGLQFTEHAVYLDGYWIDLTEVTNDMFAKFVAETNYATDAEKRGSGYVALPAVYWQEVEGASWKNPRGPEAGLEGLGEHPVVQVSWNDAQAYCAWAGRRLPTDAEWEKAARGTDRRIHPWGNDAPGGDTANLPDLTFKEYIQFDFLKPDFDDGYAFTAPVGSYPKGTSPYGILDMSGNAWEWVNDFATVEYAKNPEAKNPTGPEWAEIHVIRGASWDIEYGATAVHREINWPDKSSASLGFRCADSGT